MGVGTGVPLTLVCLNACFTHRKKASVPDPPKTHPHTHFVPEEQSEQMENYVDAVRGTDKPKPKKVSVLNSCEVSFTAADEKRAKTSTKGYDDTALMALLCRHDRVLWIVNMHSAGEKQFPALLLIETLYQHLPLWVIVGLLYNIACQLERSARKWGFLDRYLDRLIFAVAVFHAFGHDWPCQLLYHPRKRQGFGLTNGEGCEWFWHSISHLIAHLRISSYHHRLYTLDTQVKHCDEGNLFRLGEWNKRRALHSAEKRAAAKEVIEECGVALEVLKEEWEKQVAAQTKPLPCRSKNMAKKAIEVVMSLRDAVGIRKAQLTECRAAALDAIEARDSVLIQETKEEQKKAEAELAKVERQLDRKERALGVKEKAQLADLKATRYLELWMRCRALKRRLRERLRARKFELDKVERSAHRQLASEEAGIAYTACAEIAKLIKRKAAPWSAIAPEPIDEKKVWELDVDDAIWQDVGLDDDDDEGDAPIWLSDDNVRKGIPAMLDLQRAYEEDLELAKERGAMQMWFAEEWRVVNAAMERADTEGLHYSLHLRREHPLHPRATWRQSIADDPTAPPWGPNAADLVEVRLEEQMAERGEDRYGDGLDRAENGYEWDSDVNEEEIDVLDALDTADVYRRIYEDSDEDFSD
ncbi:hypothetical protein B0H19DRAFT_1258773 [Mycena capillaripes]|nr:hypothetical protein B0H19DRAFT_1258773 [Mycena capillaripes]